MVSKVAKAKIETTYRIDEDAVQGTDRDRERVLFAFRWRDRNEHESWSSAPSLNITNSTLTVLFLLLWWTMAEPSGDSFIALSVGLIHSLQQLIRYPCHKQLLLSFLCRFDISITISIDPGYIARIYFHQAEVARKIIFIESRGMYCDVRFAID
jgi:hypothetical protein